MKEDKIEKAMNLIMNQHIDFIKMSLKPKPWVAKERKNGRAEINGKRYSIKRLTDLGL